MKKERMMPEAVHKDDAAACVGEALIEARKQ